MQAIRAVLRGSACQGIITGIKYATAALSLAALLWSGTEQFTLYQQRVVGISLELGTLVFLLLSFFISIASKYFRVDRSVLLLGLGSLIAALFIFYDLISNLLNQLPTGFLTGPFWWISFVALAPPLLLHISRAIKPQIQNQQHPRIIYAVVSGWLLLGSLIYLLAGILPGAAPLLLIFVYSAITLRLWRHARDKQCMIMLLLMLATLTLLVPAHQGSTRFALLTELLHLAASFALYRMIFTATIRQPYYQIQQIMSHDGLTGLLSRAAFKQLLEDRLTQTTSQQPPFSVIQVGLDRFKSVNALLGHEHGDLLLMAVAQRLVSHLPENTRLSRFSGDNFMIFLPDCNTGQAKRTSHLLLSALSDEFDLAIDNISISASLGVVVHPNDGNSVSLLLRRADMALHQAKAQGGKLCSPV